MNDNILDFLLNLTQNPKLRDQFKDKSPDESYKLALKYSKGNFTKEEFSDAIKKLCMQAALIDNEKLEKISGGVELETNKKSTDKKDILTTIARDYDIIFYTKKSFEDKTEIFGAFTKLLDNTACLGNSLANLISKMADDNQRAGLSDLEEKRKTLEALLVATKNNKI